LERVGVPAEAQSPNTKVQIALRLLDELAAEGFPAQTVVASSVYGSSAEFRDGLAQRGLSYLVEVPNDLLVVEGAEPHGGLSWSHPAVLAAPEELPPPIAVSDLARQSPLHPSGPAARGKRHCSRYDWTTVRLHPGTVSEESRQAERLRLLMHFRRSGDLAFALGRLPANQTLLQTVRLWQSRDAVDDEYSVMRDQLGLDHFEGRSWRGFHHHACLVALAYGFLILQQR
jgi:SRSO17 transposase